MPLQVAPAVQMERDAVHARVFEHRDHAPRDEDLSAGGVVVEPGRVVDRLADEVVRVARIDLRDAEVHADADGDGVAGGRADRGRRGATRSMPIAQRAAWIVSEKTRKWPSPAVETTRPPSAASSCFDPRPVRRENQLDERLITFGVARARHLALQLDRADDVGEQKCFEFGHGRLLAVIAV